MPKGCKNAVLTNKSSLLEIVSNCKSKGLTALEAAKSIQYSESYIKKLYAEMGKVDSISRKVMNEALATLRENPMMEVNEMGLTKSQENMLYRSNEWRFDVRPSRIMYRLKNDTRSATKYESIIRKLDIDEFDALETMSEWRDVLTGCQEYRKFRKQLPEIRERLKQIVLEEKILARYCHTEDMVDIETLKKFRDSIPEDERYKPAAAITKRASMLGQAAIIYDFRYVQVCNDIRRLEDKMAGKRVEILSRYIDGLHPQTIRLIRMRLGARVSSEPLAVGEALREG
jgi:hypothetical protein